MLSNCEISECLHIIVETVRTTRVSIRRKLGLELSASRRGIDTKDNIGSQQIPASEISNSAKKNRSSAAVLVLCSQRNRLLYVTGGNYSMP